MNKSIVFAFTAALCASQTQAADQYFNGSGTNPLTASAWAATNAGPFTSAFTPGNTAVFATVNGTGTGAGGISVGGIRAEENFTLNAPTGTLATGGTVATINVFSGKTLDFGSLAFSTAAGTGFIKSGTGVLALSGGAFLGGFTLNAGTVILRGVNAMGAGGALTLNGGIVAGSATRNLTGKYTGGITIGGDVQFGALVADSPLASDTANLTFSDNMALGAATRTLTLGNKGNVTLGGVISGSSGAGLTFAAVSGAGSTVSGNGTIALTNTANTFTGDININGPEVTFAADSSLGNTANTVNIDGGRFTATASFTLTSSRGIQLGNNAGTSISAKGGSTILTYNGVIADKLASVGSWAKQGGGILQLGGVSTYTGDTAINNGTLQLTTGSNRLPIGTVVSLGQTASSNLGIFDLNGNSQQIAGLNSTSGTNAAVTKNTVTSVAAATLTIGGNGTYAYGDGTTANSGVITGALALTKTGSGSQTLGDANTYTGGTTISNGTLVAANASALGTGPVTVNGGTLDSSVTTLNFGGNLSLSSGSLNPGQSGVGQFALASNKSFTMSGGVWNVTILSGSSFDSITGAGPSSLFVISGGTLDLTGSTLALGDYNILSGFNSGSGSFGSITGYDGGLFHVTFDTTTPGIGQLHVTAVPEPGTYAFAVSALLLVIAVSRARKSRAAARVF